MSDKIKTFGFLHVAFHHGMNLFNNCDISVYSTAPMAAHDESTMQPQTSDCRSSLSVSTPIKKPMPRAPRTEAHGRQGAVHILASAGANCEISSQSPVLAPVVGRFPHAVTGKPISEELAGGTAIKNVESILLLFFFLGRIVLHRGCMRGADFQPVVLTQGCDTSPIGK